jgi:hypothetical protein
MMIPVRGLVRRSRSASAKRRPGGAIGSGARGGRGGGGLTGITSGVSRGVGSQPPLSTLDTRSGGGAGGVAEARAGTAAGVNRTGDTPAARDEPGSSLSGPCAGAAGAGGAAGASSHDGILLTDGSALAGGIPTGGSAVV